MDKSRKSNVKKSIVTTLILQVVTILCGLILPRLLLKSYGSEAYGATTSISQFLSYITLLEGGIGGVARAALYKPLADKDLNRISVIVGDLKRFFRIISFISIGYALILACAFKWISHIEVYNWPSTFLLVMVMAISTFGQYYIGISYSALIQADQKVYLINSLSILTTILNAILVIILVELGSGLIFVKLVSSLVYLIRPTLMWLYVKKKYGLPTVQARDKDVLSQKWTGLGHHIAYYLHSNTDVAVLTILDNLKTVSIYSVYHMILSHIQSVIIAFCAGMEPLFGDMIAKNETDNLKRTFGFYETLTSVASTVFFGTVYVTIVPFVKLYTTGISDANYIQPLFAVLITTATMIYCLRIPYQAVITAAGHFKQTRLGAYGEASLNIMVSVVLVWKYGLVGVAIGTIVAIGFRLIYSVIYLSRNIMNRPIGGFFKHTTLNICTVVIIYLFCGFFIKRLEIDSYLIWSGCAAVIVAIASIITIILNALFYKESTKQVIKYINSKLKKNIL